MTDRTAFEQRLSRLVDACEAGLDLAGVLAAAAEAVSAALGAGTTAAYALSDDGAELVRMQGEGPDTLPAPGLEPSLEGDRALLPLVSARRGLGCIVADGVSIPDGLEQARLAAGLAAQAVEASRLWSSAGGGAGTHDLLTGLPNHHGFQGMLARELSRAKRTGSSVAVSVVDLDGLAAYNGRHGAAEGDRVLRLAGECLSRGVRSYDCVCRLDEDEFALVLPGMTAEPAAALVGRLSEAFSRSAGERAITLSGGVAAFPEHAATQQELVRLASGALTHARAAGGGRIVAWDAAATEPPEAQAQPARPRDALAAARSRGQSADARAVSEYAGHIAAAMGLDAGQQRPGAGSAAYLYDVTTPAGAPAQRAQLAGGWPPTRSIRRRLAGCWHAPRRGRGAAGGARDRRRRRLRGGRRPPLGRRRRARAGRAVERAGDELDAGACARWNGCWPSRADGDGSS